MADEPQSAPADPPPEDADPADPLPVVHDLRFVDGLLLTDVPGTPAPVAHAGAPSGEPLPPYRETKTPFSSLPASVQDQMRAYMEHGTRPSHFLYAVLIGDLWWALQEVGRSPDLKAIYILEIALWLQRNARRGTYGDPARVVQFIQAAGLSGLPPGTDSLRGKGG